MLSSHQREVLRYDFGFTGVLRPSLRIADLIAIQVAIGSLWFPSDAGLGQVFVTGGGVRFEPMLGSFGRLFVDANGSYALTGGLSRGSFDAGLGFELAAADVFGIGPYARYTHIFSGGASDGGDAMILSFGLTLSVHTPPEAPTPPPVDTDGDGVFDDLDVCPRIPQGDTPDPERVGCPLPDTDADTIADRDDLCPSVPQGDVPDPERRGCPLPDTDGDGVHDRDDLCATVPRGDHPDPSRAGCPMPDADTDGVFDPDDICPTTAQGEHPDPARLGCPDGDDDGDGVLNASDQCRDRHQGFHPDLARAGCPQPDGDNDTVPDAVDACPTRPGAPSRDPRRNGCPSLVTVTIDHIQIQRPVFFATNQDTILPRSRAVLEALLDALLATPEIRRVAIEGHTDDVGDDAFNLDLSRRRAESVMRWLVEHGVEASRLEAAGFGETRPVRPGTRRRDREANRRVEFRVIDPPPPPGGGAAHEEVSR